MVHLQQFGKRWFFYEEDHKYLFLLVITFCLAFRIWRKGG